MSEKSKKYRVPRRRGVPWALLAALSLAVYLLLTFDTGEYSIYIIVVTAAVVLLWLARFFRKKNISREYTDISSKLSTYYEERTERDDYNVNIKDYKEYQEVKFCEFCGATQSQQSSSCENCGKNLS